MASSRKPTSCAGNPDDSKNADTKKTGVVAIPLGAVALGSGAVGVAAKASGQTEIGGAFSTASKNVSKDARKLVEFSNAPLSVTDDVIIRRQTTPAPQAAPAVPFTPQPIDQ